MSEWEEKSQEKEAAERETAEDMRSKAVERLRSKKKRKKADEGAPGGDNSEERISPKEKSSDTNLVTIMEAFVEMERKHQEQQRQIRNRELDLRASELQQQQQFQSMLLQQHQQYQQQQQAMNMAARLNTVSEIFKSIKEPQKVANFYPDLPENYDFASGFLKIYVNQQNIIEFFRNT